MDCAPTGGLRVLTAVAFRTTVIGFPLLDRDRTRSSLQRGILKGRELANLEVAKVSISLSKVWTSLSACGATRFKTRETQTDGQSLHLAFSGQHLLQTDHPGFSAADDFATRLRRSLFGGDLNTD
jgi:hypothetical protein